MLARPLIPALLVLGALLAGGPFETPLAHADGWIHVHKRPHPPRRPHRPIRPDWGGLLVTKHWVDADIDRGMGRVVVNETFHNPNPVQLEGTYYFPLPPNSQIDDFRAVLGGKELAGEILPRDKARQIYEGLVRRVHDPALLEYYDRGLFKARVFPIPARGDVQVTISYRQTLHRDGGFTRFRYPLDTGRFTAGPYQNVRLSISLTTDAPIRSVSSPSHTVAIEKIAPNKVKATFEASTHAANKDFLLDYMTSAEGLAGGVRAFRESGEDGYFMLRLAPGDQIPPDLPPVTVVFVMDTSGSMAGRKMDHTRRALITALDRLRPQDRFQILSFASRPHALSEAPLPATPANVAEARTLVEGLMARGGTDISSAMDRALLAAAGLERGATILLMTDGAPTVGETDPQRIVKLVKERTGGDFRVHIFGVGHDVNTILLDDLARFNGGSRTYLSGTENLELAISGLVDKVTVPCLSDLQITVDAPDRVVIDRVEPQGPHDLFFGEDLIVAGRYRGEGPVRFMVTGDAGGVSRTFVFPATLPRHGGAEEAAYLWAQYRIYSLLDEMRSAPGHAKARLKGEIVDLGLRFGIVTPYTSFLIQEDSTLLSSRIRGRLGNVPAARAITSKSRRGFADDTGVDAFDFAREQERERKEQKRSGWIAGLKAGAPATEVEKALSIVHRGGRAFIPVDGELRVEGSFQEQTLPAADTTLLFGTDDYLTFLRSNPRAAKFLSSGRAVLFRWKGKVIRVDYDPAKVPAAEEPVKEPGAGPTEDF